MNKLAVLLVFATCLVASQAFFRKSYPTYPVKPFRYCYDYLGRPVRPGSTFYDGCNTCSCGRYGRPTRCTMRYCPPTKPIYHKKRIGY